MATSVATKGGALEASAPGRPTWLQGLIVILSYALLIAFALAMILPFIYSIINSFKLPPEIASHPERLIPAEFTLRNYKLLTQGAAAVPLWTFNSAIVAAVIMAGHIAFDSLAGYALARLNFPGRGLIFLAILGTMMIPGIVLIIPRFIVLKQLGWLGTYQGLMVPGLADAFGIFLMKQFFEAIPGEIEEAAKIDGASRFEMFWRIVMPMAGPALAALAIFGFQGSWNDLIGPLIVVANNRQLWTLPLGLALLKGGAVGSTLDWGLFLAGSLLTTLPMAFVFLFFQRYFIEGVSYSGLKG
ncbi:MAG: carbohydrate ABC transporter permease [Ardenticatenaceae bacterium]|nr:carbohydrate ABC transporter permease [Ardenticatenaceae bacterium]HBY98892.1 ABC transporter permease [Chloroflexota bacterium]